MRIQTIRASNYLNLRARVIEIPGTANAVVIAGPNGSGKTALLDGIRAVLDGTLPRGFQYKKDLSALITDGEKDGFFGVTVKRDDHSGAELKLNLKSGTGTNPLLEPLDELSDVPLEPLAPAAWAVPEDAPEVGVEVDVETNAPKAS